MNATEKDVPQLEESFLEEAERIISQYPVSKRSASLPLLHLWQKHFGFVSPQGVQWIAEKLGLEPIAVEEIATFYPMIRQRPLGHYQFKVCRTLSCALAGSYEIFEYIKKSCKTVNEVGHHVYVSEDGKFSVEFVECLAACGNAPVMMLNEEEWMDVSQTKINAILDHLMREKRKEEL
ncbi:NAD(P)H-dependent oxidoreductase subunit E [Candidatus Methylacidiphilum fumarolicum]|uniref:NADH-ubiquinone oxidoreductase chain E n=2 Tax=Candidatus Methylacidiphilum fumarolicum TaxID=591154 RepID=I0JVR1_METFB|nr:NAD(P)H-dependent oxidoreductase subunit E [Candidatus Methylacidiphilum fumarolicum]MBW6414079.1 NAD(P)H-dependent oxidoreductase subunit E [Candidatus Methylacidiphilum fumarolicum]TFE66428.1 NADH dehydrogenase [Candidatus Methylacidiphilum fumarolicum]TFE75235.1 NAD(P)H-dependent oxidoreductase subunit E [Candidatus Methylacidiphilum fumarolicum]TFE76153.1 NAD(P)H-dependent oxidoreductase subunit E [Candidatus Methylacidiphilum fumarolicum]TFE77301.1 NADH dehydrogenase [Candidatus Methyl